VCTGGGGCANQSPAHPPLDCLDAGRRERLADSVEVEELPNGAIIGLVGREGDSEVPSADFTLQRGDHLTFLGRKDAVHEAISWCHPHD
jgi:Trk K+ transport system NAD-binding subunit